MHGVKLLTGTFAGVEIIYQTVSPKVDGDVATLSFNYSIWDSAGLDIRKLVDNEDFENTIGDVLTAILLTQTGEYAAAREYDSQEPNL